MLSPARVFMLTLIFAVPLATAAQSNSGERPGPPKHLATEHRLVLATKVPVKSEFADLLYGPQKCDGSGNLFFQTDLTGTEPLKKLNLKGELVAQFRPRSNPDMPLDGANDFTVDANGDVYLLVFPHEINRYVFAFKSDGTYKSAVKLNPGFAWVPSALATFQTGGFLVSGLAYNGDNPVMIPFTGVFAADGTLLKEVKLPDDDDLFDMAASGDPRVAASSNSSQNHAVSPSKMQVGSDGNLYLMRALNPAILCAISPGGEVVRRFTVHSGNTNDKVVSFHMAAGKLAVLFWDTETSTDLIKVVDLEGHELAAYREPLPDKSKPDRIGSAFACYLENPERFIFLSFGDNNQLEIETVEGR